MGTPPPLIRDAQPTDLDAMVDVFVRSFNAPPWNDGWTTQAARERLEPLVAAKHFRGSIAVSNAHAIGLILGQKQRWVDGFHFDLVEMCVLPARQRSGIGSALLGHLLQRLRKENVAKVVLMTAPSSSASAFYAKYNFYASRARIMMGLQLNTTRD